VARTDGCEATRADEGTWAVASSTERPEILAVAAVEAVDTDAVAHVQPRAEDGESTSSAVVDLEDALAEDKN